MTDEVYIAVAGSGNITYIPLLSATTYKGIVVDSDIKGSSPYVGNLDTKVESWKQTCPVHLHI